MNYKRAGKFFKKISNVFTINKNVEKDIVVHEAEIFEHECYDFNLKSWRASDIKYTYENEGQSAVAFPSDSEYLSRLDPGFYFDALSEWICENWVDGKDFASVREDGSKTKVKVMTRRRRWVRKLHFREGDLPYDSQHSMDDETASVSSDGTTTTSASTSTTTSSTMTGRLLNFGTPAINMFGNRKTGGKPSSNEANINTTRNFLGLKDIGKSLGILKRDKDPSLNETDLREDKKEYEGDDGRDTFATRLLGGAPNITRRDKDIGDDTTTSTNIAAPPADKDKEEKKGKKKGEKEEAVVIDSSFHIRNQKIKELGKQIKELERESDKIREREKEEWKKERLPFVQAQVNELEGRTQALRKRLEEEMGIAGMEHATMLEKEVNAHQEVLEDMKRNMYFPFSPITLGSNGVYCAFDDIWLESMSGYISFDLHQLNGVPCISLVLTGSGESNPNAVSGDGYERGLEMKFKVDNFKSAGDKGKSIPRTTFAELKITLSAIITIAIFFDADKGDAGGEWVCDQKEHFHVELLKFRGPFGARKSMVNGIIKLVTPKIKRIILEKLPKELGMLISSLQSPFEFKGSFNLKGAALQILSDPITDNAFVKSLCQCSTLQMHMFMNMQKYSMERNSWNLLTTVSDLLAYIKSHRCNSRIWRSLCVLWEQACTLYSEELQMIKAQEALTSNATKFSSRLYEVKFVHIIGGIEEIRRKKLDLNLKVNKIEGQASLNKILRYGSQFLYRYTRKEKEEEIKNIGNVAGKKLIFAKALLLLDRIAHSYDTALQLIKQTCRNFDFAEMKIVGSMRSGADGFFRSEISNLFSQFPLLIDTGFSKPMEIWGTLVPFKFGMKPQSNGDVIVELAHVVPPNVDIEALEAQAAMDHIRESGDRDKQNKEKEVSSTSNTPSRVVSRTASRTGSPDNVDNSTSNGNHSNSSSPSKPTGVFVPKSWSSHDKHDLIAVEEGSSEQGTDTPLPLQQQLDGLEGEEKSTLARSPGTGEGRSSVSLINDAIGVNAYIPGKAVEAYTDGPGTTPPEAGGLKVHVSGDVYTTLLSESVMHIPSGYNREQHRASIHEKGTAAERANVERENRDRESASMVNRSLSMAKSELSGSGMGNNIYSIDVLNGGGNGNTYPNGNDSNKNDVASKFQGANAYTGAGGKAVSKAQSALMMDLPVLTTSVKRPHISIIVDQQTTLKPGAELFSLMMGPRGRNKRVPFGCPDMVMKASQEEQLFAKEALPPLFDYMRAISLEGDMPLNNDDTARRINEAATSGGGEFAGTSAITVEDLEVHLVRYTPQERAEMVRQAEQEEEEARERRRADTNFDDSNDDIGLDGGGGGGGGGGEGGEQMPSTPPGATSTLLGLNIADSTQHTNNDDHVDDDHDEEEENETWQLRPELITEGICIADLKIDESDWETELMQQIVFQKIRSVQTKNENGGNNLFTKRSDPKCPLFVQTAPGIKMLAQVPKVDVIIHITAFVRFLAAHFIDLELLKYWLEETFGGEVLEEHLVVGQVILERFAKYLLLPGLNAEINLNMRVIAQACEVIIRFDTPEFHAEYFPESNRNSEISPSPVKGTEGNGRKDSKSNASGSDAGNGENNDKDKEDTSMGSGYDDDESVATTTATTTTTTTSSSWFGLGSTSDSVAAADDDLIDENINMRTYNVYDHDDSDDDNESPLALKLNISVNLLDLIEDFLSIAKSITDAKQAFANHASEQAERAMAARQEQEDDSDYD